MLFEEDTRGSQIFSLMVESKTDRFFFNYSKKYIDLPFPLFVLLFFSAILIQVSWLVQFFEDFETIPNAIYEIIWKKYQQKFLPQSGNTFIFFFTLLPPRRNYLNNSKFERTIPTQALSLLPIAHNKIQVEIEVDDKSCRNCRAGSHRADCN